MHSLPEPSLSSRRSPQTRCPPCRENPTGNSAADPFNSASRPPFTDADFAYSLEVLEKDLYASVERYAQRRLRCFKTAVNTGLRAGRIDVVGLRDVGGNLEGSGEVIAIEVKRGQQSFLTAVGQAAAYSVYADRCYLADIRADGFKEEERTIAAQLGVGLLQLKIGKRVSVTEKQLAPIVTPHAAFRLELIEKLHYSLCTICTSFFERGDGKNFRAKVVPQSEKINFRLRAVEGERGLIYWLGEQDGRSGKNEEHTYTRRYICPACVSALFG